MKCVFQAAACVCVSIINGAGLLDKFCLLLLFYLDAFGHPISSFSGFYSSTCSEVCSNTPSVCLMCKPIYLFLLLHYVC